MSRDRLAPFVVAMDWSVAAQAVAEDPWLLTDTAAAAFADMLADLRKQPSFAIMLPVIRYLAASLAARRTDAGTFERLAALERRIADVAQRDSWAGLRNGLLAPPAIVDEAAIAEATLLLYRTSLVGDASLGERVERVIGWIREYQSDGGAALARRVAEEQAEAANPPDGDLAALVMAGAELLESTTGDRAENVSRAQRHYRRAIELAVAGDDPAAHIVATLGLANALAVDPRGCADTAREANEIYETMLAVVDSEPAYVDYAISLRINFARFLWEVLAGDEWQNKSRALVLQHECISLLAAAGTDTPARRATLGRALHNLGRYYFDAPFGVRSQNIDDAVDALERALPLRPADVDPIGRARTLRALAVAYPEWSGADSLDHAHAMAAAARAESDAIEAALGVSIAAPWAELARERSALFVDELDDFAADPASAPQIAVLVERHERAVAMIAPDREPLLWAEWMGGLAWLRRLQTLPGHGGHPALAYEGFACALAVPALGLAPRLRRKLLQRQGALCHGLGNWSGSLTAHTEAVAIGRDLVSDATSPEARRRELTEERGFAQLAAYAAGRLGDVGRAIELAELSRARLLIDDLAVVELAESDAPEPLRAEVVAAYRKIKTIERDMARTSAESAVGEAQRVVARLADSGGFDPALLRLRLTGRDDTVAVRERDLALQTDLRTARVHLRDALARARAATTAVLPDTLSAADIQAIAARSGHSIVYLFATVWGGMALAASPTGAVAMVELEGLTSDLTRDLLYATDAAYVRSAMLTERARLPSALARCDAALAPALDAIAALVHEHGSRVTLIPIGSAGLLPLHVAALRAGLVPAFAPSARALSGAVRRRERTRTDRPSLVVIADPGAANLPALALAKIEGASASALVQAAGGEAIALPRDSATVPIVLATLGSHSHLHVACHGTFRPSDPMTSAIHLASDDELLLSDILGAAVGRRALRLAVLSACQSGLAEFRQLPDELVGFSSAFLLAGAVSVVATAWKVDDVVAALFCHVFYDRVFAHGDDVPTAVSHAQRWLRDAKPTALLDTVAQLRRQLPTSDAEAHQILRQLSAELRAEPAELAPFANPEHWGAFVCAGA